MVAIAVGANDDVEVGRRTRRRSQGSAIIASVDQDDLLAGVKQEAVPPNRERDEKGHGGSG